jgi:hypothetical protein
LLLKYLNLIHKMKYFFWQIILVIYKRYKILYQWVNIIKLFVTTRGNLPIWAINFKSCSISLVKVLPWKNIKRIFWCEMSFREIPYSWISLITEWIFDQQWIFWFSSSRDRISFIESSNYNDLKNTHIMTCFWIKIISFLKKKYYYCNRSKI